MAESQSSPFRRLLAASVAASLVFALPSVASAAPPSEEPATAEEETPSDAEARAMEAYSRGTKLYNDAQFEEALSAFEEAATLYASPAFQFNIAKCHERLGNLEEAIRHYETYLRTSEDTPDRAVIESSIADLKKRLQAEKDAANRPKEDPVPTKDPVDEKMMKKSKQFVAAGGALIGVGAAIAIGGGVGFGLPVAERNKQLGEIQNEGNPNGVGFDEAEEIDAEARKLLIGELVLIGVGSALAITGIALLAVGLQKKKKALAFAPAFGPGFGGVSVGGRF